MTRNVALYIKNILENMRDRTTALKVLLSAANCG
jgi:hypothetical protein